LRVSAVKCSAVPFLPMGEVNSLANLSLKGGAYGAAYGVGSSRSLNDVPVNALAGGAMGAAVPAVLGKFFKPKVNAVDPLVDPVTGELNQPMVDSMNPAQRSAVMDDYGMKNADPWNGRRALRSRARARA
jgi:hypothetical protein